ncbi:hypothetical protein Tco_0508108 [Tanacetum coccineum]
MDSVVCICNNTTLVESDECLETNHNKKRELSEIKYSTKPLYGVSTSPIRHQRYQYLRFEGLEYTDADIADFKERLGRYMVEGDAQGQSVFTSRAWRFGEAVLDLDTVGALQFQLGGAKRHMSWREFILGIGLHTAEEMEFVGFRTYWAESARQNPDKGDLSAYWRGSRLRGISLSPKKVTMTDLFYLRGMDVDSVNIPYLLARYLRRFASRRKREAIISRGQFIARLAEHFGLLTEERL